MKLGSVMLRAPWLLAAGLVLSCTPQPRPQPAANVRPPAPVVTVAEPDSSSSSLVPPRDEPAVTYACGGQQCRVGKQSCCSAGDRSICVDDAPPDPPMLGQLLASQIEACRVADEQGEVGAIARCRSSAHCAATERCCEESLFSGAVALICKDTSCDHGEVCSDGSPCRDPSMVCAKQKCRKRAEVPCGNRLCDLRTHTCHTPDFEKPRFECVPDAQLTFSPIFSVECLHHGDCPDGELCRSALGRTFCERADYGMTSVMCDTAADCPSDHCALVGKPSAKPRCLRDASFWHASCACR
jgi:hypothetical protein